MSNNNEIIGVKFCFHSNIDREDILRRMILDNNLGLSPTTMNFDYNEEIFDKEKAIRYLDRVKRNVGISFEDENTRNELLINYPAIIEPPLTFVWKIKGNVYEQIEETITFMINQEGFTCGYIYNYQDVLYESETSISELIQLGYDEKSIKKTRDRWDEEIVDISENYGRQILLKNGWLMAAPKIWLSNLFLDISKIKEEAFQGIGNCKRINSNVIFVSLSENVMDVEKYRSAQKNLRRQVNFDLIEQNLDPY